MINFKTGNLFDAPKGVYLAHACNCMGMWGSGVALEFNRRFPKSYLEYQLFCKNSANPGDVLVCSEENGYQVVCLFTSKSYGKEVDSVNKIIKATKEALEKIPIDKPLHMPMINAGLFRVPWSDTASLLSEYDDLDITIWSLK